MAALIVLIVVALVVLFTLVARYPHRAAGARRDRRAAGALPPHARRRARAGRAVRGPRQAADRPARDGGLVPAAAGDHRGQPRDQHRHGHLLPGDRPEGGDLRDRELHRRDRAAHRHHAPKRGRRDDAGGHAHLARQHQRRAAHRARRGDRQVGHPREPRGAEGGRPAGLDPGGDGEADARRARPPRGDPHRRGRQAVADPHRRGREAVARSCARRAGARRRSSRPRASRRRSRRSSPRSTAATPTRSCSPTSTCRCCRRSPRASRTRSGSSRARSRRRWTQLGGGAA